MRYLATIELDKLVIKTINLNKAIKTRYTDHSLCCVSVVSVGTRVVSSITSNFGTIYTRDEMQSDNVWFFKLQFALIGVYLFYGKLNLLSVFFVRWVLKEYRYVGEIDLSSNYVTTNTVFIWSKKQNILLQHMHKKEFWILTNKCGNNLEYENEVKEPCRQTIFLWHCHNGAQQ